MEHWKYQGKEVRTLEDVPDGAIGFIYRIDNNTLNKWYYGRKTIRVLDKKKKLTKKEKELPENKRKTFKYVEFEYKGWQEYTGSSDLLNDDIKRGHKITKEIVRYCYNKKQLTAWELKYIMCDGITEEKSYNANVMGKIFKKDFK